MHENCGHMVHEYYSVAYVLPSENSFWYMNLIPVSNSRLFVHGNKFQIKACLLKENRGYAFSASNKKVPGHSMLVCLQMVQLKP